MSSNKPDAAPNKQQLLFIKEYIKVPNKTQAAIKAGYSKRAAAHTGSRLYKKFKNLIDMELMSHAQDLGIDKHYVLRRLKEIDELDVLDILDDAGNVLPIKNWPKEWRTSIAGIEVSTVGGEGGIEIVKKIKWPDKTKNLDMIGKHTKVSAWGDKKEEGGTKENIGPNIYIVKLPDNGRG